MTDDERRIVFEAAWAESLALEQKYRRGERLTRADCNAMRKATQRMGIVAREVWIQNGRPPGFPELEKPIKLSPLPKSMQPLDLTGAMPEGGELN